MKKIIIVATLFVASLNLFAGQFQDYVYSYDGEVNSIVYDKPFTITDSYCFMWCRAASGTCTLQGYDKIGNQISGLQAGLTGYYTDENGDNIFDYSGPVRLQGAIGRKYVRFDFDLRTSAPDNEKHLHGEWAKVLIECMY